MNIENVFTVYIDRALTEIALRCDRLVPDNTNLNEWFTGGEGDIERVYRTQEISELFLNSITGLGNIPLSDFCYDVLEHHLGEYLSLLFKCKKSSPSNEEIVEFLLDWFEIKASEWK